MVISIAIPSATENTSTVDGLIRTPAHPITPAVIICGMILVISEQIRIRNDLNRFSIQTAINRKAQKILSCKPLMIKRLPSRNVTEAPVSCTEYFEVSK